MKSELTKHSTIIWQRPPSSRRVQNHHTQHDDEPILVPTPRRLNCAKLNTLQTDPMRLNKIDENESEEVSDQRKNQL
jgi:hypothetical protein